MSCRTSGSSKTSSSRTISRTISSRTSSRTSGTGSASRALPCLHSGSHRQATVLPWMAQRPAMGRIEARRRRRPRNCRPRILGPTLLLRVSHNPRRGIVEQPRYLWLQMAQKWEKRPLVGISWIRAPLNFWSPSHFSDH